MSEGQDDILGPTQPNDNKGTTDVPEPPPNVPEDMDRIVPPEFIDEDPYFQALGFHPIASTSLLESVREAERQATLPFPGSPAFSSGIRCKDPSKTPERRLHIPSSTARGNADLVREPDLWSPALSRALRERYVGNRSQRTPSTITRLMQQHRENERHRHRSMIESIHEISERIPGYRQAVKETKIVKLQRIINYVCHLEGHLQSMCNEMDLGLDFKSLFLTPHISGSGDKKSYTSKSSTATSCTCTVPSASGRRNNQPNLSSFHQFKLSSAARLKLLSSMACSSNDPVLAASSSVAPLLRQSVETQQQTHCFCTPSTSSTFLSSSQSTSSMSPSSGSGLPAQWNSPLRQTASLDPEDFDSMCALPGSSDVETNPSELEWLDYTSLLDAPEPSSDLCSDECDHMLSTMGMDNLENQLESDRHNLFQLSPEHLMPSFSESKHVLSSNTADPGTSEVSASLGAPNGSSKSKSRILATSSTDMSPSSRETAKIQFVTQEKDCPPKSSESSKTPFSEFDRATCDRNEESRGNLGEGYITPTDTPMKLPSPYRRRSKRKIKLPKRSPLVSLSNILKTTHQRAVAMAAEDHSPIKLPGGKRLKLENGISTLGESQSGDSLDSAWDQEGYDENAERKRVDHRRTSWMNGFMMYSFEHRRRYIDGNPGFHTSHISKLMGQDWRRLSSEEQKPYWDKAKIYIQSLMKPQLDFNKENPYGPNMDDNSFCVIDELPIDVQSEIPFTKQLEHPFHDLFPVNNDITEEEFSQMTGSNPCKDDGPVVIDKSAVPRSSLLETKEGLSVDGFSTPETDSPLLLADKRLS